MKKLFYFLIISLIFISILNPVLAITSGDRIMYPLYSSVCCKTSTGNWVDAPGANEILTVTERTYTCPQSTAQCRVRTPTINCPPSSFSTLYMNYVKVGAIKTPYGEFSWSGDNIPSSLIQGIEFQKSTSISYAGSCINPVKYVLTLVLPGFSGLIALFSNYGISPATSSLQIEMLNSQLWRHPALEGEYSIANTVLCQRNLEVEKYANQLAKDEATAQKASQVAQDLGSGKGTYDDLDANAKARTLLDTSRFEIDECRRGIDKWIDLPFLYNVNPKGQYNGQDVICSIGKGIVSVKQIGTYGGSNYYVPDKVLLNSGFCCNDQDCKYIGTNFNCEQNTYQCKEIAGYCNNDLDCMPEGGEQSGMNCVRKEGKFYNWASSCISNKCSPFPVKLTESKCCPAYCQTFGQYCNPEIGCEIPKVPQQDCPAGKCCDGKESNRYTKCSEGLECCMKSGEHMGICKKDCAGIIPPSDECKPLWSSALLGIKIPSLNPDCWAWGTGIRITTAILLGLIGFAVSYGLLKKYYKNKKDKWLITILSILISGVLAVLIYFIFWIAVIIFIVYLIISRIVKRFI